MSLELKGHVEVALSFEEVVTGLVILNGLFGWMDILIMSKWLFTTNQYSTNPLQQWYIANLPSVITVMINNFMK